jgi:hypothetical protein
MDRPKVSDVFRSTLTEVVMAFRNKIYFIILGIVAQLLFFGDVRADELQPNNNASEEEIATVPAHDNMTLVSSHPWVVEGGKVWGTLAAYVYDDVTTKRAADYWELYDSKGDLIAISWFDRFGIQRLAVDRGLIDESDKLEGTFVVFLDGDSV